MRVWPIALLVACSAREPQPLGPRLASDPTAPTARATAAPKTPYERLEVLMPQVLAALTELGESLRGVKDDCSQLAKVFRTFADKHAAKLPEMTELIGKLSDQERQRFELDHHDDREQLDKLFAQTKFKCLDNAEVRFALEIAGFLPRK